jgi:hypothetical protein
MRKLLLHIWIWGGLTAFYFVVKFIVGGMSTDAALGFWFGIVWALGCIYGHKEAPLHPLICPVGHYSPRRGDVKPIAL